MMEEKYKKDAEEILEAFSKSLEEIPETPEAVDRYVLMNVLREDGLPTQKNMHRETINMAPKKDRKGHYIAERVKL